MEFKQSLKGLMRALGMARVGWAFQQRKPAPVLGAGQGGAPPGPTEALWARPGRVGQAALIDGMK